MMLAARFAAGLGRPGPPDADLLARYRDDRDPAAFAELVRRHGPAVLAVCRRVARNAHDADDAFQATFLVLARKADRVRPGPLGGWLVGVAVRAARKAARRPARTGGVPDVPAPAAGPADPEAAAAVAEEVGRLPDGLRDAVVLCELEGRSRAAAARALGVPEGTLSSRLATARKRLAARLRRRGFAPAAVAALVPAVVPRALAAATARVTSGRVPPAVQTLTRGVTPTMDGYRLPLVSLFAGLAAVAALAAQPAPAPTPPAALPVAPPPAVVRAKGPNQLFFCWDDAFYRCDPDGKNGRAVTHPACRDPHPNACSLSPDGTKVVYALNADNRDRREFRLLVFAADGTGPATDLGDGRATLGFQWSGDGSELLVTTADPKADSAATADVRHEVVNVATRRRTRLPIPADHHVTDWSRDGTRFVTVRATEATGGVTGSCRTWVLTRAGDPVREVVAPAPHVAGGGRLSPDGRRVLYDLLRPGDLRHTGGMHVFDLAAGTSTPVADIPPGGEVAGACWSPDGRRIAYTWQSDRVEPKPGVLDARQKIELRAFTCDPDGRNRVTVAADRSTAGNWSFGAIEWR